MIELSTALSTLKALRQLGSRIKDAEFKGLLADLQVALADVKVKCAELQEENLRLKSTIAESKKAEEFRTQMEFREGVYYFKTPPAGRPIGPYCPGCLDSKEKLQVLRELPEVFRDHGKYECPACEKVFGNGRRGGMGDDFTISG
jgi:hypothetical protein